MNANPKLLPCDGCGLPASPEHIADRVRRLELSTRFRPVHIGVLFVALAPPASTEDDFYAPPATPESVDPFFEALQIHASANKDANGATSGAENGEGFARLSEFQHRGFHLAYLSECPIAAGVETAAASVARLGPTLLRRIRFNYRPKHIAPIGQELAPLIDILNEASGNQAQIGKLLTLGTGQPLPDLRTGGRTALELFQRAVAGVVPRDYLSSGYDRIQVTQPERDFKAGGNS